MIYVCPSTPRETSVPEGVWSDEQLPKMARHSFFDISQQHKFLEYAPHHGRRNRLIQRQSRRVTPIILYRGRAHRLYFQFRPFVYFFCGWFVGGEPPTRRAVLPVLVPRYHRRQMWVIKQQRVEFAVETTPPGCRFDHSTIFDYSFIFPAAGSLSVVLLSLELF